MTLEEAKDKMLEKNAEAILQAIILRYQAFTIISGLSLAFLGIGENTQKAGYNQCLFNISIIILTLISVISLGRFMYLNYEDRKRLIEKRPLIENWDGSSKIPSKYIDESEPWLLILYIFFTIGIFFLVISTYFPDLIEN